MLTPPPPPSGISRLHPGFPLPHSTMGRGGSSDDEEGESGRKNLKRMLKVLKFFVGLMLVSITLDHILFDNSGQRPGEQKQRDAERVQEVAAGWGLANIPTTTSTRIPLVP